jgi:hypothetical protein
MFSHRAFLLAEEAPGYIASGISDASS